jgi:hypothetical protein
MFENHCNIANPMSQTQSTKGLECDVSFLRKEMVHSSWFGLCDVK